MDKREYKREWDRKNADKQRQYQKEYRLKYPEKLVLRLKTWRHKNPEKAMLQRVRARAKRKQYEFNLEISDIMIPSICPILGISIDRIVTGTPRHDSPSLDRIDNIKGYVKGNVMVISHKANMMKQNATPEELIRFAQWIFLTYGGTYDN